MQVLENLIQKIDDPTLRESVQKEVEKLLEQKKFGLIFEEHLPDCIPLYDIPIQAGSKVSLKLGDVNETFTVEKVEDDILLCENRKTHEKKSFHRNELVSVAEFGEPVYPFLKPVDTVCNAPESDLWHTLIEADNYHALQLLKYLYTGKVDCIYIDPPYNTGARDWKYNNDYVDSSDSYRHSKWLSMMQRRLRIAKRLLNPENSVLIVTIDEKEYHHLGCLLEEMFPEARIQMVSSVINPGGVPTNYFKRIDEYIFFVMNGECAPERLPLPKEWSRFYTTESDFPHFTRQKLIFEPIWASMIRTGTNPLRSENPNLYYPIFADPITKTIKKIGTAIPKDQDKAEEIPGLVQILPYRKNGDQGRWMLSSEELKRRIEQGRVRVRVKRSYEFALEYLPKGEYEKILRGEYTVDGYAADGSIIAHKVNLNEPERRIPPTQWRIASHNAGGQGGSGLLNAIFLRRKFNFPKSVYAVHDAIRFFVQNKPEALILDFFAGSGTTLHAVNLLNAEDGGKRRCILVTNNEISSDEAKSLIAQGHFPGDPEWEKLGIAEHITWQRTVCSIEGHDVNGNPLKGNYLGSNRLLSKGFQANAIFFKLGFLDKDSITTEEQLKKMLQILWLKSGARGPIIFLLTIVNVN